MWQSKTLHMSSEPYEETHYSRGVASTDLTGVVEDDNLSVERSGFHGGVVLGYEFSAVLEQSDPQSEQTLPRRMSLMETFLIL